MSIPVLFEESTVGNVKAYELDIVDKLEVVLVLCVVDHVTTVTCLFIIQVLYPSEKCRQFLLYISEDQQMSSSKALANKTTTFNTELFAIKLGVSKATSMDIEYIILITNSLGSVRRTVDFLVHSEQAHSLAICSVLILLFSGSLSHSIDCLSKVE